MYGGRLEPQTVFRIGHNIVKTFVEYPVLKNKKCVKNTAFAAMIDGTAQDLMP
jgi:hypothetical protein